MQIIIVGIASIRFDKKSKIITMTFKSKEEADKCEIAINQKIFKCINEFIREKGENPKNYNRNIITFFESIGSDKGGILRISY